MLDQVVGAVNPPSHFHVLEIGDDYVAGLRRDGDDIEHIRVYALPK